MDARHALSLIGCFLLLPLITYSLSVSAAGTKSATVDEPMHLAGAWSHVYLRDFHINPEDPPLWNHLAMLPIGRDAFNFEPARDKWERSLTNQDYASWWVHDILSKGLADKKVKLPELIDRSRRAMAIAGALLVVLTSAIAWRLAGRAAGMLSGALIALEPTLLGHAPLVKNDVAITLVILALAASVWALTNRITLLRILLVGALCGVAASTKFSGVLMIPLTSLALLGRAVLNPAPWPILRRGKPLQERLPRAGAAVVLSVLVGLISVTVIWGVYGLRFAPNGPMDRQFFTRFAARRDFYRSTQREPTPDELREWKPTLATRALLWTNDQKLLPNAFCMGMIFTHGSSLTRPGYLMGEIRADGRWYYFPAALMFKLPTATLTVGGLAIAVALGWTIRARGAIRSVSNAALVFVVLTGGYFAIAMSSRLNLGVRHVLPVLPFIYIGVAVVFACALQARRRITTAMATMLALGLSLETVLAWPNYIAFFNAPSGGARGGLRLLTDSNLDWGQDLPLLVDWQNAHPGTRLYLMYFGGVDPSDYGVQAVRLPNGTGQGDQQWPSVPGVIAISATHLQGTYLPPALQEYYAELRNAQPREVLGGTIYLYDYPLRQ